MNASGIAALTMLSPNSRRRLKPLRMRRPSNIPPARPTKIAANTTPQPALPPWRVFLMYGWPSPTTTPPAANAPTMPMTRPRTTGVRPINRQPSQMILATAGAEMCELNCRLGISRSA
jgi:hypothetical protein